MKKMKLTKVVHLRKEPYDVRIDRYTKFGNPFKIPLYGNRIEVINKYEQWLKREAFPNFKQSQRKWILGNIHMLKGKTLGCWYKPKPCHGDVLVKLLED